MKRTTIILLAVLLSFSFNYSKAQISSNRMDRDQFVFWFYIRAEIKINRETKRPSYVVRNLGKTPKSGKLSKYEKDLWRYMQGGQQLAVGPFEQYDDAIRAIKMYDLARHTNATMEEEIKNFKKDSAAADEYFWFVLKYKISKRTRKYLFERTAARVHPGSLKAFKQLLWEGLSFEQLAIGPFPSQLEAEEAKRLYRLEED